MIEMHYEMHNEWKMLLIMQWWLWLVNEWINASLTPWVLHPYNTRIPRWGYSRSDKHTCSYIRSEQWGSWGWGPRHGLRGWPLRSSCWGPRPPSSRGSVGAGMAMEAAVLSPESEKERPRRSVRELINNQMKASFVLRWVKKKIKIQEQCIREVRKYYHCL
jgi:hypothetical protein